VPDDRQSVPLAHAAREVHRVGLQAVASGLRGAEADGADGVGGEGEETGCRGEIINDINFFLVYGYKKKPSP